MLGINQAGSWKESPMNLVWKEFRESYPVVALGLGVIFFMLVAPLLRGQSEWYGYVWGLGFHTGATAILFFVSIILGVTAYAVEEEQETLTPLLAKPVPANDILATKLGVRLGLLFLALLLLGFVELITGAWPIEWNVPAPEIFLRWLGSVSLCIMGLGFGLYFGKTRKHQTTALLLAASLFAAGFVVLYLTPLKFLFDAGEGPTGWFWVRESLIPSVAGTAAILAGIWIPEERRKRMPRAAATGIALAAYALLILSLTALPIHLVWWNPEKYKDYWNLRFGGHEKAIEALTKRTLFDDPGMDNAGWLLERTNVRPAGRQMEYYTSSLLGPIPYQPVADESFSPVGSVSEAERFFVAYGNPQVIETLLNLGIEGELSKLEIMTALHTAGVMNDPEHTDLIAQYLNEFSTDIQSMAALLLTGRGDERGIETLIRLLPVARPSVVDHVSYFIRFYSIDLGPDVGEMMRSWLLLKPGQTQAEYRELGSFISRRRAALTWIKKYGNKEDLPLVKQALWANLPQSDRDNTTPAKQLAWSYLKAWNEPYNLPDYRTDIHELIAELLPEKEWAAELYSVGYGKMRWSERLSFSKYRGKLNTLNSIVKELLEAGDPEAISLWQQVKPLLEIQVQATYYRGLSILNTIAEYGEVGMQELERLLADPKTSPEIRFQSALILIYHGWKDVSREALHLWELYRNRRDPWLWHDEALEAFLLLLEEGHTVFAGQIIAHANRALRGTERYYRYYGRYRSGIVGTSFWNSEITDVLSKVTGRNYGWDLKAWKKWWDEEGKALSTAGN